MKITTLAVRGVTYDVDVNPEGKFGANFERDWISKNSLDELREELVRLSRIKAKKISIPFIIWTGKTMKHGTCTGRHATNRNLLLRYDGVKESTHEQSWGVSDAVDPAVEAEYTKLCVVYEAANKAKTDFEKKHAVDLKKRVEQELSFAGSAE